MKYICIGLPCSGLRKVERFFKQNSLNTIKRPLGKSIQDLAAYDAVIDTVGIFKESDLAMAYPDAVLVTTKPQSDWTKRFEEWLSRDDSGAKKERFGENPDAGAILAEHNRYVAINDIRTIDKTAPPAPSAEPDIISLVAGIVLKSPGYAALVDYLRTKGLSVESRPVSEFDRHFGRARNLITWGVKKSNDDYRNKDRRVLFVENGIHRQAPAFYLDDMGYSDGSSLVQEGGNLAPYTDQEEADVVKFIKDKLKHDFNKPSGNPDGPILVALQTTNDAPLKFHFPLSEVHDPNHKDQVWRIRLFLGILKTHLPINAEVVVRKHPKDGRFPEDFHMPENWRFSDGGPILDEIRGSRAVVTINSTVVSEALSLGVPVATFGTGCFSGSHATVECAHDPTLVSRLFSRPWPRENTLRYLCAIHRNNNVPYRGKSPDWYADFFKRNEPLNRWVANLHLPDRPAPSKRKRAADGVVTCIYCANRVVKTGCGSCRCSNCNRPNF